MWDFLWNCFVQKLWREKANKYVLTATSMAPMERDCWPFLVLLKSNGRLQATWHGKAASY